MDTRLMLPTLLLLAACSCERKQPVPVVPSPIPSGEPAPTVIIPSPPAPAPNPAPENPKAMMADLPGDACYAGKDGSLRITSREFAVRTGLSWVTPYPYQLSATHIDCGFFSDMHGDPRVGGGWRVAYCRNGEDRVVRKLFLWEQSGSLVVQLEDEETSAMSESIFKEQPSCE